MSGKANMKNKLVRKEVNSKFLDSVYALPIPSLRGPGYCPVPQCPRSLQMTFAVTSTVPQTFTYTFLAWGSCYNADSDFINL